MNYIFKVFGLCLAQSGLPRCNLFVLSKKRPREIVQMRKGQMYSWFRTYQKEMNNDGALIIRQSV
jgi:hypothetical protein